MAGSYGSAVLVLACVALLLKAGRCEESCAGVDGHQGVAGTAGRDGKPGVKGEKGEPAVSAHGPAAAGVPLALKGSSGTRGSQGDMGPKGFRGDLGPAGPPGRPGPRGQSVVQGHDSSQQAHSAFSVIRTDNSYPRYDQTVTYQAALVNTPGHFDIATGRFTCRVPGVYYFSFQASAKVTLCLRIASPVLTNKLGFCNNNPRSMDQVLSGGAVLQLTSGQRVWLESFRDEQKDSDSRDTREKMIVFNGFLLFSNQG